MTDNIDTSDLDAYLADLATQMERPIARAVKEQAQMLSDAQRAALRSLQQDPAETGDLEQSCTTTPGRNDLEVIVQAGGDATIGDVREGSGVPYDRALAFEFGNSRQQARPFFYPTYREKRDDIVEAINNAAGEALK